MEVLKPKWVDNIELKRNNSDSLDSEQISSSAVLPAILKHTVEVFLKQLPSLIASFSYMQKAVFKRPLRPLKTDLVSERFFSDAGVIAKERVIMLSKAEADLIKKKILLKSQMAIRHYTSSVF